MPYNQSPQEFGFNTIIPMDYPVTGIYYISGIRELKCRIFFQNSIYSLPHNLCLPFNSTYSQPIFFKKVKTFWETDKKALQFVYGIKHILKMFQYIFVNHKSTVLYGSHSE